jgi:hypothetical protein
MTPPPVIKPEPIENVHKCPICGKYCDAKTGQPYLFESFRKRYFAHKNCINISDFSKPTPYGPRDE